MFSLSGDCDLLIYLSLSYGEIAINDIECFGFHVDPMFHLLSVVWLGAVLLFQSRCYWYFSLATHIVAIFVSITDFCLFVMRADALLHCSSMSLVLLIHNCHVVVLK